MVTKPTFYERIGGTKGLLTVVMVICAVVSVWAVNDYRIDRIEVDLGELESDYKEFSKKVLDKMNTVEIKITQMATRQERLIEDVRDLK